MQEDIDMKKIYGFTILCLTALVMGATAFAGTPARLEIEPNAIFIGASYNGIDISVTGEIPSDTDAVVRLKSKGENFKLKKKGKAMGLLWMNMATVSFHNCPSIFMVSMPGSISGSSTQDESNWESLGLGLKAVEKEVEISPEQKDKSGLFQEFIKLKEKEGKYKTYRDGIHYTPGNAGTKTFSTKIAIPDGIKIGQYMVELFVIKDSAVVDKTAKMIKVDQVGFPRLLSSLAFDHSLLYGIMAVMVALIAGLITGLVFKGGKGAH